LKTPEKKRSRYLVLLDGLKIQQDAAHTFFAVYPVVCDQLESLADACSSAASDAKALLDSITRSVVSLSMLNYIMKLTKPLSTILQSSENDLKAALDAVERVKQQLRQWRESDCQVQYDL
jgi:hypothetical protein